MDRAGVNDLENLLFSKLSIKSTKKCWGCKIEENDVPFKRCPKCDKHGTMASYFCSQECFVEFWPQHKAWHKELKSDMARFYNNDAFEQATAGVAKDWVPSSKYDELIKDGNIFFFQADLSKAKKKFKKAQKLDPRRPEAYSDLGNCFRVSNQFEEANTLNLQAIERWSLVALTGLLGNGKIEEARHPEWATGNWAEVIKTQVREYISADYNGLKKPDWYCQDAVLKRVTGLAWHAFESDKRTVTIALQTMTAIHAYALSGIVNNGEFQTSLNGFPPDRTTEELKEAAACFDKAAEILAGMTKDEKSKAVGSSEMFSSHVKMLLKEAQERDSNLPGIQHNPVSFYEGCWVIISGFTSIAGQSLNLKLGLVKKVGQNEGRLGVKVEDVDGLKLIKPQNMNILPIKDSAVALVSCLPPSSQWTFMKPMAERIIGELCVTR